MPPDKPLTSPTELEPPYEFESLWCGGKDGMRLSVWCYDKRFNIFALAENLAGCETIKNHFLALVQKHDAMCDDDYVFVPGQPDPMQVLCDWMAEACFAQMRELAPHAPEPRTTTLEEYYAAPIFHFILKVIDGKLTAVRSLGNPYDDSPGVRIPDRLFNANVPLVDLSQITIPWDHEAGRPMRPSRLFFLDNEVQSFKPAEHGAAEQFEREIDILLKLQRSGLVHEINVPRLLGFVVSSSSGNSNEISGILLSYINGGYPLSFQTDVQSIDQTLRDKWCSQLKQMVDKLHAAGIIWGDVSANNVLVDDKNDIWTIDFGGSYTPGWVEEDLKQTVQGDLQGLSKIIEFINGCGR